jgi:hypothetical protein
LIVIPPAGKNSRRRIERANAALRAHVPMVDLEKI